MSSLKFVGLNFQIISHWDMSRAVVVNNIYHGFVRRVIRVHILRILTSSHGNIFCVTGPFWDESIGYRWIPLTKASDIELLCFLWYEPEQTVEQTPMIWEAMVLIMTSLYCGNSCKYKARILWMPF